MKDWILDHKVLVIILGVVLVLVCVGFGIRAKNTAEKERIEAEQRAKENATPEPTPFKNTTTYSSKKDGNGGETSSDRYNSQLSLEAQEAKRKEEQEKAREEEYEKRKAKEAEEKRVREAKKYMKPTYGNEVLCWDTDGVPDKMVDGSSCKVFLRGVSLSDFGSKWGKTLTMNDKFSTKFVMVGVDQNPKDYVKARDCQSLGWLISNFSNLDKNTAIKFTDLNTIGSLSKDHVAVLCSYDWYSAFGMDDTLVVFEDISGTLKRKDFTEGTIFSAMVYKHNIRIKHVNGQNVVCIQYAKGKGW